MQIFMHFLKFFYSKLASDKLTGYAEQFNYNPSIWLGNTLIRLYRYVKIRNDYSF